jgi:hypothetical protein
MVAWSVLSSASSKSADVTQLLPAALVDPFTASEPAAALARSHRLAQRMDNCLRGMGVPEIMDKPSNALPYFQATE